MNDICSLLGFKQCRTVVPYRRFGTTYRSHLQESAQYCLILEDIDSSSRSVGKKLPL